MTFFNTFGSFPFLFGVICISFILKAYLLIALIKNKNSSPKMGGMHTLLTITLASAMIENFAWIIKLIQLLFIPTLDYRIVLFWIRMAWGLAPLQYHALSLFVENLIDTKNSMSWRQKIFSCISCTFLIFFVTSALINFQENRNWIEQTVQTIIPLYSIFFLMMPTLFLVTFKLKSKKLPNILRSQGIILIKWIMVPQLVSDFLQSMPLFPYSSYYYPTYITNSYAVASLSTLLTTFTMYFCAQKMIGLRFLNFRKHVETKPKLTFVDEFKTVLHRLSHVTTLQELSHITQVFFKESFDIPFNKTHLYMRTIQTNHSDIPNATSMHTETLAETLLESQGQTLLPFLQKNSILIYDELDFTNFYHQHNDQLTVLHFLKTLNADIFLPLFERKNLVGYIIVERYARLNEFYNSLERDEMLVFAGYLGAMIHLIKNKSLELLVEHKQRLTQQLHAKHKEIEQYKESMRSFLRTNVQEEIGVLYYHNRKFTFGNASSKAMIPLHINTQEGHPITQTLRSLAKLVEEYKAPQKGYIKDPAGNQLVVSALPHLDKNVVILTVYYPNISDIIKQQIDLLKNPTEWDYILYLETTKSGRLINQMVPGSAPTLLQFKIDLLKASFNTKAILLDVHEKDLFPTVELLHHISMRDTLYTLTLHKDSDPYTTATQLFGINPIFNSGKECDSNSLLKVLDTGTLFIQNIHYLDIETQNYLAEFLNYGIFRVFKSDRKLHSNTHIICSSDKNLEHMVQQGTFSSALYDQIQQASLHMPSLMTLPDDELYLLADEFSEQMIQNKTLDTLVALNQQDKSKLAQMRPASLTELKNKVHQIVIAKSKKHIMFDETSFNPTYQVTDPDLLQAKCLGRRALKDRRIMIMLWDKFKNQSDIATFLGVNRSSVNRRCKEYSLQ